MKTWKAQNSFLKLHLTVNCQKGIRQRTMLRTGEEYTPEFNIGQVKKRTIKTSEDSKCSPLYNITC